jgi:hypothetical protein
MGATRHALVHLEVGENLVEITWDERAMLLDKLSDVAGSETTIERFWAVGVSEPVVLNDQQRSRLRVTLETWGVGVMPDRLAYLRQALMHAEPGASVAEIQQA